MSHQDLKNVATFNLQNVVIAQKAGNILHTSWLLAMGNVTLHCILLCSIHFPYKPNSLNTTYDVKWFARAFMSLRCGCTDNESTMAQ